MKYYMLLFLLATACLSCTQQSEEEQRLFAFLSAREIPTSQKIYFFVPTGSCGYCTDKSLEFMENYGGHPDIFFIVSGLSKRDLTQQLGKKSTWQNVYLDTKNNSFREGVINGGVTLFYMENGGIQKVSKLSPTDIKEALQELSVLLNK